MIKILFVCHGNICRSPMAEFVMKELVRRAGRTGQFAIASAATSTDEIGADVYQGTQEELIRHGIPFSHRHARQVTREDYDRWDHLVVMDKANLAAMPGLVGLDREGKVRRLLEFAGEARDVADPWYTGDFTTAYRDISRGCEALLKTLCPDTAPAETKGK